MNSALESLRKSNPRAFERFMKALTEDLGVGGQAVVSFTCPNCRARLDVIAAGAGRRSRGAASGRSTRASDGLNDLLIELARQRRTTTGTINAQFKKEMGRRIKNLDKKEQRAQKVQWLKSQLGKAA